MNRAESLPPWRLSSSDKCSEESKMEERARNGVRVGVLLGKAVREPTSDW